MIGYVPVRDPQPDGEPGDGDATEAIADAVVVAAGASSRMGGIDKILAPIAGRPLLAWSLDAMRAASSVRRVIVVARSEQVVDLRATSWVLSADAEIIAGGSRRQVSVAAGVRAATADLVLVHDAARPLIAASLVDRVARTAALHGAAVPVVPVSDTLKRVTATRVGETVDRAGLAAAQTPQAARRELLVAAYTRHDPNGLTEFTDEAAMLEADGVSVALVEGDPVNLKVTLPADLAHAEALLLARTGTGTDRSSARDGSAIRVGHGYDRHPFGSQDGLALGGVTIPEAPRLHGHSDGDVALHAVADAMLGAAGLGDLGRSFPAGRPETRGVASGVMLREVTARVVAAGWQPIAVHLTIVGARPRLGGRRLDSMAAAIAELLGLEALSVAVSASTGNLSGDEGAGRVIAATALVTLLRRPAGARTMAE
ncbi:MAG: 2-C-methyl-D-erythritol 4-phosphate cytidylyltransferase [Chloroflexi bacterium]|nr:2-C-methyl-D-erythritol 4-phosphate cytidylyltransferase [Chloroflexota bacterium]